jgi:hypothetical protein
LVILQVVSVPGLLPSPIPRELVDQPAATVRHRLLLPSPDEDGVLSPEPSQLCSTQVTFNTGHIFLTFCVLFSAFADKLNEQMKAKDETVKSLVETGEECMRLASNAPGASGFSKAIAPAIADATNPPGSG